MESIAFEKGIVRIESDDILTWEKAKNLANEAAGGLPTREEIIKSELHSKETDYWTYVRRDDHIERDAVELQNDDR